MSDDHLPYHVPRADLEGSFAHVLSSPRDEGELVLVVRRPAIGEREVLDVAELSPEAGLVGDSWAVRRKPETPDLAPHPDSQLTLMSTRVVALLAQHPERWPLAGDQLFVDLDLGAENVPAGTRLAVGEAVLEITSKPHLGCAKFAARFGRDALAFISAPERRALQLRGVYARVVRAGRVRRGEFVRKLQKGGDD